MGLADLGSKAWSVALPLALAVVRCPTRSSSLLRPHSWSYVRRHELLHLFAATWMQSSRTHPVSKSCLSLGASWNNTLHCCPTFLAGAGDMLQPDLSSWPGVMQGPGAGQPHGGDWGCPCGFACFYLALIFWWPNGLLKSLSTRAILVTPFRKVPVFSVVRSEGDG